MEGKYMRKLLNYILIMVIALLIFTASACESGGSESFQKPNNQTDSNNQTEPIGEGDPVVIVDQGYSVTFTKDENVTITVYATQALVDGVETLTTVSKDGTTGEALSDGNGQVNFSLSFKEGYELKDIQVEGTYKNLKYPFETGSENTYRITKVESELVVNVTSQAISTDPIEEDLTNAYKVTLVLDEFVTSTFFKTQELVDGTTTSIGYARDGSSGALSTNGDGQVNFTLAFTAGYMLDSIQVEGTYKNIKYPLETGSENTYRITKIQSDLTVTITSKLNEEDLQNEYVIETTDGTNSYQLTLTCLSGSCKAELADGYVDVTVYEASEIALSDELYGSLKITGSDTYPLVLDLNGVSITAYSTLPALFIDQFDEVEISVKKATVNNIFDEREQVEELASAVYITCDATFKSTGTLNVQAENNNGIHCKDDLTLQKLTLNVTSVDNALKGNDSVTINSGTYTLIAKGGDAIKTSNSDISSKGKQRGTITILDGTLNLFAATDGLDASYDVVIGSSTTNPVINIYTDKYSEYSEEVTKTDEDIYLELKAEGILKDNKKNIKNKNKRILFKIKCNFK